MKIQRIKDKDINPRLNVLVRATITDVSKFLAKLIFFIIN